MNDLAKYLPQIIKESATSPFGILALMIIVLAFLGFVFFKRASEKTRVLIFAMLFAGVAAFGAVIIQQTKVVSKRHAAMESNQTTTTSTDQTIPRQGTNLTRLSYPKRLAPGAEASSADAVYRIIGGQVDRYSEDKLKLRLTVRLTNNGRESELYSDNRFRLLVDGIPLEPKETSITDWVGHDSAKEGDVVFILPSTAKTIELRVGNPGRWGRIPIDLN